MRLSALLLLLTVAVSNAANWYIDNAATGSNAGTSWANAWTNVNAPTWASVQPGDTVYISGGTTSNTYWATLDSSCAGSSNSPIWIRTSQEAGHNGKVYLPMGVVIRGNYCSFSGALTNGFDATNLFVNNLWSITNNINCVVSSTNTSGVTQKGNLGQIVEWVEVAGSGTGLTNSGNPRCHGIWQQYTGVSNVNHVEIRYCYVHDTKSDGINVGQNSDFNWGDIKLHHNVVRATGDDNMQVAGGTDIYFNDIEGQNPTHSEGHPDPLQTIAPKARVWNNRIVSKPNSYFYEEAVPDNGDYGVLFYGNLCLIGDYRPNYSVSFGTQWLTGRGSNVVYRDFVVANNTIGGGGNQLVQTWKTLPVTNNTFINAFIVNNILFDGGLNGSPDNTYSLRVSADFTNDVRTEWNVISGYSKQIAYGSSLYTTSEAFDAATGFVGNRSTMPTFVDSAAKNFALATNDVVALNGGTNLANYLPTDLLALMPDYDIDLNGVSRGSGGGWDIGALESTGDEGQAAPEEPPTISAISPSSTRRRNGKPITITGQYFTGVSAVYFGDESATFSVQDDTHILANPPGDGVRSDVPIRVETSAGSATNTEFKYVPMRAAIH